MSLISKNVWKEARNPFEIQKKNISTVPTGKGKKKKRREIKMVQLYASVYSVV